ncbi:Putative 2-C-methyl-D-erythritol 4-phosphate cytidylyltransferase 2 [Megamonas hypermegale]|jgi:2-C-methyl-D-erythritol 4-phosphate cytidylyltransferase|uniref:2-C-methyl-D-erythritol 4-phosphate cytidylyltransferase n=1 Tax=Megamonas hypermegale TaxID=158847 RepID=A0A378NW54_9FIRM|nr:2-C-methyl-D-erythritol 4-phosphate cytidylyltransferase [Megamonas hypermegale]STY72096.1 Putative 2-C-methyl-D-erythritol 4-phosphate cytidylyltransferase 2 [Megamonas hypermegale]
MNIAVIFAGGSGQRMNTRSKPKQFLDVHGKPVIVYTLEIFQEHKDIDGIILVCIESWIEYTKELTKKYNLTKVLDVIPGGKIGQESIFLGLKTVYEKYDKNSIVLIHDGVRPLINNNVISDCLDCVDKNGNAVTIAPAIETIFRKNEDNTVGEIFKRSDCLLAKAPQCFYLKDIYNAHLKAQSENKYDFIDSASMMQYYGYKLYTVEGPIENIKITTPSDFYIFRAIMDARENLQILGF